MYRSVTLRGLSKILEKVNGKFLQISRNDEDNYIMPFKQLHSFICREKDKEVLILEDNGMDEEYSNIKKIKETDIASIDVLDEDIFDNEISALNILITFVSGCSFRIIFN